MADIHIITACKRINNLDCIKDNLEEVSAGSNHNLKWHICFDAPKTEGLKKRAFIFKHLKSSWIKTYEAATHYIENSLGYSQINFVIAHFKNKVMNPGFLYILDDDNLLPPDFFDYNYDDKLYKIYLFPQLLGDGEIRECIHPEPTRIDQAQVMWHSDIDLYYNLCHKSDGQFIQNICNFHPYCCLDKPIVYYNKLAHSCL